MSRELGVQREERLAGVCPARPQLPLPTSGGGADLFLQALVPCLEPVLGQPRPDSVPSLLNCCFHNTHKAQLCFCPGSARSGAGRVLKERAQGAGGLRRGSPLPCLCGSPRCCRHHSGLVSVTADKIVTLIEKNVAPGFALKILI